MFHSPIARTLLRIAPRAMPMTLAAATILIVTTILTVTTTLAGERGVVVRVPEGDLIVVSIDGREEEIRLIGVDTPGRMHAGNSREIVEKYSALTRRFAEDQSVRLERDSQVPDRDSDGKMLRYVFLEDGTLLNAEIIKGGFGRVDTRYPFERSEEFRKYHDLAVEKKIAEQNDLYHGGIDGVSFPELIDSSRVLPKYPEEARNNGTEGKVILQVIVQKDGTVGGIKVLRSPGPEFEKPAIAAVRQWRYKPGISRGRPVDVYSTIVVDFTLEEKDVS